MAWHAALQAITTLTLPVPHGHINLGNDHPLLTNRYAIYRLETRGGGEIRSNTRIMSKGHGVTDHEKVLNSRKVIRFLT